MSINLSYMRLLKAYNDLINMKENALKQNAVDNNNGIHKH